jgi:hypothetical protein
MIGRSSDVSAAREYENETSEQFKPKKYIREQNEFE